MAAAFATLLTLLAVQQAAVLAGDLSWGHHHHKSPTVVEVVRYGQACPCAKTLPFELEVPVKPKDPLLHTYGYAIEAPPPREPLPLYSYDYELEVPVKKHPPIKRTYGYEVQAPPARERLPLYSYDYELEVPTRSPDPPKLHNLETRLERVLLPKHDCPWHAQADALLRSPRGLGHGHAWGRGDGYGLVEPDEEAGAGRVVPLAGPTRILPTSGPALAPREEFYDSGKTYEVVHSSPLALISGGDGGRLGFYPEDLAGLTKPWSPLPGPAYLAGSVLGRDFRSDLHFAPERPRIQDEPPAGRYVVNRYEPERALQPNDRRGRRSRRAVSLRFTLSEGYESLEHEEEENKFVQQPGRQWRGQYVTDRMGIARVPQYPRPGSRQSKILDPDDIDDLAFRHPLDRYFTNVKDWKEVVDFKSKVLGSANRRQELVKSHRVPWWSQSPPKVGPIYRPPVIHNAVLNSFSQEPSEYHLTPAPKALPKSVYSVKILPDAAYDDGYKASPIKPKTFGQVGMKGTRDENYRLNVFGSQTVQNELRNRFDSRFQDQRLSSSNVNGFSPVVVPYLGQLSSYSLGSFLTGQTGNGLSNIRNSLMKQDVLPTHSLLDVHSNEDFSLDEIDRQLLEEEKRTAKKKSQSGTAEEVLNSEMTSKPRPSDVYSLKVLPDPVEDQHFSLEEIDKVQMISMTAEKSHSTDNEFSPDLARLKNSALSNELNILPNTDVLLGTNNFATINSQPSGNIMTTNNIVTSVFPDTPHLLNSSPNYAPSVIPDRNYNLNTMPGFISGKVNQLNTFSSLLSDEIHLLDRGPVKFVEKKNIKELNSKGNSEDVNGVLSDGERRQIETVNKNSREEPGVEPHQEEGGSVAGTDTVKDVPADSTSQRTEGNQVSEDTKRESAEAVRKESEEGRKHVDGLLFPGRETEPEQVPGAEALPDAGSPVDKVQYSAEGKAFTKEQAAEDKLVSENKEELSANRVQSGKEQQKGKLGSTGQEEADTNETELASKSEPLGTADSQSPTVVEELGSAGPVELSSVGHVGPQNVLPLSRQPLGTQPVGEVLTGAGNVGTQQVETRIVPLEGLHRDTRNWHLDDHHREIDEVEVGENFANRPWYGLWYGHGNEVKSVGLPKLYELHDAILERNRHDGEKVGEDQESGTTNSEQTTEYSLREMDNDQEIHEENNPVTHVPVEFHHSAYPQEIETKSSETVFDYFTTHESAEKVRQPDATEDEILVHDDKWDSHRKAYSSPRFEENSEATPSTESPKTSPASHTQQSWSYLDQALSHRGEEWGTASAQQPLSHSYFSKSDRQIQPGHDVGVAPKFGLVRGNPKYYLQYPRRINAGPYIQRSDHPSHNVRGESFANTDSKTKALPNFEVSEVDPTARYIQQFRYTPDNIQPYRQGNIMTTINNQLKSHHRQYPPYRHNENKQIFTATVRPLATSPAFQTANSN